MIVNNITNIKLSCNEPNKIRIRKFINFRGDVFIHSVKKSKGDILIDSLIKEMEEYINSVIPNINFKYPLNYKIYDQSELLKNTGWSFPKGKLFLSKELEYLAKTFNESHLIPFAVDNDAIEYACFVIDGKTNNKVKTVYPFGEKKDFYQDDFIDINDWIKNGI